MVVLYGKFLAIALFEGNIVRSHRILGWVERNNSGSKIPQVACLSETQPPQRLLLLGLTTIVAVIPIWSHSSLKSRITPVTISKNLLIGDGID